MYQIIQCKMCGSPYKVPPKFKYCHCEKCPWVLIENAPYTYGIIRKNIDAPIASYIRILYEQLTPDGPFVPVRDDERDKRKKKKKRYIKRPPSRITDYSYLVPQYEKEKKS